MSFPPACDLPAAAEAFLGGAADLLEATDYADACPIATIALEIASVSEPMREAAAEVFASWTDVVEARGIESGLDPRTARDLALELFCCVEGGFLHGRATRDTAALRVMARRCRASFEAALSTGPRRRR
jgi:hypothetical protein